jgi:hypothetical protein
MRRISHIDALRRSSLISLTFGDLGGGVEGDLSFFPSMSNFKDASSGDAGLGDVEEDEQHAGGASVSAGGASVGQTWQGFEAFQHAQLAQLQQQQQLSMLSQMNHNMGSSMPGFGFEDMSGFAPIDEHGLPSRSSLFNPAFLGNLSNLSKLVPKAAPAASASASAAPSAAAAAAPGAAAPGKKRKSGGESGSAGGGKKGKGEEAAPAALVTPSNATARLNKAPQVKTESAKSKAKLNLNGGITGAAPMMGVHFDAAKSGHVQAQLHGQHLHMSEQQNQHQQQQHVQMPQQHHHHGLHPSQHLQMQQMHLLNQQPQQQHLQHQHQQPLQHVPKKNKIKKAAAAAAAADSGQDAAAGEGEGEENKKTRTLSSKYRGVSKCSKDGRWQARIRVGPTVKYLGRFKLEEDAARCYDAAAAKLHGARAQYNFAAPPEAEVEGEAVAAMS